MAAFYMTGAGRQWYQWMHATDQLTTWDAFSARLELRFSPSTFINHKAQLFKLKQNTTVVNYLSKFECLSIRVTELSSDSLLQCFLSGLRDDIQRELSLLRPTDLHDAIGMAKLVEDKCNAARAAHLSPRPPPPRPYIPSSTRPHTTPLLIKHLSPTEMAARREKGLCFNCDHKFTLGHKYNPAQFLCLMVDYPDNEVLADEAPPPEPPPVISPSDLDDDSPCISFHALTGRSVPSTLKLAGSINGQPVVVLIDGGSTNNFVHARLADHLQLTVLPSPHLHVTVGNGETLGCSGECRQVALRLGNAFFEVDLFLLPIYGADLVLVYSGSQG